MFESEIQAASDEEAFILMLAALEHGPGLSKMEWDSCAGACACGHTMFLHAQAREVPCKDGPGFPLPCGEQVWCEVT